MSGVIRCRSKSPRDLADALDLWALRREKVLSMIDVRAAKQARKLARTCRVLGEMEGAPLLSDTWEAEWDRTWAEATTLIDPLREEAGHTEDPIDEATPSQRVTRAIDVAAILSDDRPTRVVSVVPPKPKRDVA